MAHNQTKKDDIWTSPEAIMMRFDVDADERLDRPEFDALCSELFGAKEIEEHDETLYHMFEQFVKSEDGMMDIRDLRRIHPWICAIINPVNVFLVVDVQNDFIDGTLALRKCGFGQDGVEVIEPINKLLKKGHWNKVIYSQDWHPENHISFFENLAMRELHPDSQITKEKAKPFDTVRFLKTQSNQKLWPKHCVMNTWGAELHKNLLIVPSSERVQKGQNPDKEAYSVFDEKDADGVPKLVKILSNIGCTHLYVCGLAYDVCVQKTCLDGLQLGYQLAVVDDCCRGVNPATIDLSKTEITSKGGLIASSDEVLLMVNEGKRNFVMASHAALVKNP